LHTGSGDFPTDHLTGPAQYTPLSKSVVLSLRRADGQTLIVTVAQNCAGRAPVLGTNGKTFKQTVEEAAGTVSQSA
jgi:hypothetical protein